MEPKQLSLEDTLYVFAQSIDLRDENVTLTLDAVKMSDVQRISNQSDKFPALEEMETYYLVAEMPRRQYASICNEEWFPVEGEWRRLTLEDEAPVRLTIFNANTEENLGPANAALHILELSEQEIINENIILPPEASQDDVQGLFSTYPSRGLSDTFTAVYGVGQGLCCAVCERPQLAPLVYFDFGCGCYQNAHTRPQNMRFCFSSRPPIILSHWHQDHYKAAHFLDRKALNTPWLVPNQRIGPTSTRFAAALHRSGHLCVWPNVLPSLRTPWGTILKCTGNSVNSSGLACIVRNQRRRTKTLLPGDADYDVIPGVNAMSYTALVASHHGGNVSGAVPSPQGGGRSYALSYGICNSYGHPAQTTLQALANAGWGRRLDSVNGHLGLVFGRQQILGLGCGGRKCDLQIVQV